MLLPKAFTRPAGTALLLMLLGSLSGCCCWNCERCGWKSDIRCAAARCTKNCERCKKYPVTCYPVFHPTIWSPLTSQCFECGYTQGVVHEADILLPAPEPRMDDAPPAIEPLPRVDDNPPPPAPEPSI